MEFCPNCGTRVARFQSPLTPRCLKCGNHVKSPPTRVMNYLPDASKASSPGIAVLDKEKMKLKTLPTVEATCLACGNKKAETWTVPIGSEGTSAVTFFRCTSCGHTTREKE